VHNLVSDFRFGQLEDQHRSAKNHRQETKRQRLPRLQGDQSESEGHQGGRFEFQTEQERYHHLLDETTTCDKVNSYTRDKLSPEHSSFRLTCSFRVRN